MAPEVFKHRKYDKKVDVFSFAMILYEVTVILLSIKIRNFVFKTIRDVLCSSLQMLEGEPPFSNFEPYEAAKYVAEGHRPTFRSKGFNVFELREYVRFKMF
jgi:serine/threonine protein kinase